MKKLIFVSLFFIAFTTIFSCNKCEDIAPTPCGTDPDNPMVDLIILIDASGSMSGVADTISSAALAGIASALDSCQTDLQVTYLGIEGTWPGTMFTATHRNYVYGCQGSSVPLAVDNPYLGYPQEQGANAIEDLARYACWREGACRAIFYISDEELDGSNPRGDFAIEDQATQDAINAAQSTGVAVFSHFLNFRNIHGASIVQNYNDLSDDTGGTNFMTTSGPITNNLYLNLFPQIICNACNGCSLNQYSNKN